MSMQRRKADICVQKKYTIAITPNTPMAPNVVG
jgi:hypothetical protein